MLNRPFKQKIGALDFRDEVVSLRHCHSVELPFNRCVVDFRFLVGRFELHDDGAESVVAAHDGDADGPSGVTANGRPEVLDTILFKLYTQ